MLNLPQRQLSSAANTQLPENAMHVFLDAPYGKRKFEGNLLVGLRLSDKVDQLGFTQGEESCEGCRIRGDGSAKRPRWLNSLAAVRAAAGGVLK